MRFIADGMLGSLTRWLRMIGCDVEYLNNSPDDNLLEIAGGEDRILLTRDLDLYRRAQRSRVESLLIEGRTEHERLAEVAGRFGIKLEVDPSISRCPACNSPIRAIEKSQIGGRALQGTLRSYDRFWECTLCYKVYWRGSHWRRIRETLKEAKRVLEARSP